MKKKEITFCLRLDKETFKKLKVLSDKYDRSINSEINILLNCLLSKWERKTVKYIETPNEINKIQDTINDKEYLEALDYFKNKGIIKDKKKSK